MTPDIMQQLEVAAREVFDALDGRLPVEFGVDVVICGGLTSVSFKGRCGSVCSDHKSGYRLEIGDSVQNTKDKLLNTITRDDIRRTIREQFLREMAEELGFEVKKKGGRR